MSALGAFAALLFFSENAREVAGATVTNIFLIFSTPFVLETTSALLFLFGVLAYNHWRLSKEGDGWVYLVSQESSGEQTAAITQRLQGGVILAEKPSEGDEALVDASVIEGYLELGMSAEAFKEFQSIPAQKASLDWSLLQVRVLAANMDTAAAQECLSAAAVSFPDARLPLAKAALENATWLWQHLKNRDLARHWLGEMKKLDVTPVHSLPSGHPLLSMG